MGKQDGLDKVLVESTESKTEYKASPKSVKALFSEHDRKMKDIFSKAIHVVSEKGHYEQGQWWRVYDEKEPKGNFLGIFQIYGNQFMVVYEKIKYITTGELHENVEIYDHGMPVFRTDASLYYGKLPVLKTASSLERAIIESKAEDNPSTFHINSYVPGEWERHLDDLYSSPKK